MRTKTTVGGALAKWRQKLLYDWPMKHLNGHVSFRLFGRPVTFYFFNAMWLTLQIHTRRWGYVCFRLPSWHPKMRWKLYLSPNATPTVATFAIGPGISKQDKRRAKMRAAVLGHNYRVDDFEYRELIEIEELLDGWPGLETI